METLCILARDREPLTANLFLAHDKNNVCVIHSATATSQKLYFKFAHYLASRGFSALTYDYRGIGLSLANRQTLKEQNRGMTDWIKQDASGIHDWVQKEFRGAQVCTVGHSFGGQLIGLLENSFQIQKALLVSCPTGYWRMTPFRTRPKLLFFWYFLVPFFMAVLGYVPLKKLGLGEDLPAGVIRQWRKWCLHPDYILSEMSSEEIQRYKHFPGYVMSYGFLDDSFLTPEGLLKMLSAYPQARSQYRLFSPEEISKQKEIGHFGFFKEQMQSPLWEEAVNWLQG